MRRNVLSAVLVGLSSFVAGPAAAFQEAVTPPPKAVEEMQRLLKERSEKQAAAQPQPSEAPWSPRTPEWTDAKFEAIGAQLSGSWKSESAVTGAEGASSVVMSLAPVRIDGLPNAIYCEVSRADAIRMPYRQTILALQPFKGKVRMTTYEFRRADGLLAPAALLWAAPEVFPVVKADELVATLAIDLEPAGSGWKGSTPHPYPTRVGGAVEMTSEIAFDGTRISVADRGFGTDGAQVWGPPAGQATAFTKFDTGITVKRLADGLTAITLPTTLRGEVAKDGERISVHYAGYLTDGRTFDSSYERGSPFPYSKGQPLIPGWNMLMEDIQAGMVRKLAIPSRYAFGAQGRRGSVPPNSPVFYEIEVLSVDPAPPPAPAPQPIPQPVPQPVPQPSANPAPPK